MSENLLYFYTEDAAKLAALQIKKFIKCKERPNGADLITVYFFYALIQNETHPTEYFVYSVGCVSFINSKLLRF